MPNDKKQNGRENVLCLQDFVDVCCFFVVLLVFISFRVVLCACFFLRVCLWFFFRVFLFLRAYVGGKYLSCACMHIYFLGGVVNFVEFFLVFKSTFFFCLFVYLFDLGFSTVSIAPFCLAVHPTPHLMLFDCRSLLLFLVFTLSPILFLLFLTLFLNFDCLPVYVCILLLLWTFTLFPPTFTYLIWSDPPCLDVFFSFMLFLIACRSFFC